MKKKAVAVARKRVAALDAGALKIAKDEIRRLRKDVRERDKALSLSAESVAKSLIVVASLTNRVEELTARLEKLGVTSFELPAHALVAADTTDHDAAERSRSRMFTEFRG
jgi:hypothetical protein